MLLEGNISNLPLEIIVNILKYLPLNDLIKSRSVCHSWQYAIEQHIFESIKTLKLFQTPILSKHFDYVLYDNKLALFSLPNDDILSKNDRYIVESLKGPSVSLAK